MAVSCGQCKGDILLISDSIASIEQLSVDGVSCDAEDLRGFLFHQWKVIASGSRTGGKGRSNGVRPSISGIDSVVFIHQRLMPVFLRPQGPGDILCAVHYTATLIVQT